MHSSPNVNIVQAQDYRDGYANSVQVRASVWDFMLIFGAARQDSPDEVVLRNSSAKTLPSTSRHLAPSVWNQPRLFPRRIPETVRYTETVCYASATGRSPGSPFVLSGAMICQPRISL
jgi:hypothetical protein